MHFGVLNGWEGHSPMCWALKTCVLERETTIMWENELLFIEMMVYFDPFQLFLLEFFTQWRELTLGNHNLRFCCTVKFLCVSNIKSKCGSIIMAGKDSKREPSRCRWTESIWFTLFPPLNKYIWFSLLDLNRPYKKYVSWPHRI